MKVRDEKTDARRGAALMELITAVAILSVLVAGFARVSGQTGKVAREYYVRAVAMEIVDGESEVLAAGEWKAYGTGTHRYEVKAGAARNLPPGSFTLTVGSGRVRLEWAPASAAAGSRVVRERTAR